MSVKVTPRQCDLLLTRTQKWTAVLPIIMFVALPVIFFAIWQTVPNSAMEGRPPFIPWFPFIFFPAFAIYFGYRVASLPYRISSTLDQQLVFKSLLTSRSVRIVDVQTIEPGRLGIQAGISGYVLKHRDGKIQFTSQFTGLYALLYEMKQANPTLDIRGF
jgi:hypothetical protein